MQASRTLREAESTDGIAVSVATLVDLWYVTQTTARISQQELTELFDMVRATSAVNLCPIDVAIADAYTGIDRELLRDPWDRFIVATALVLQAPLVTRDSAIQCSELVQTVW